MNPGSAAGFLGKRKVMSQLSKRSGKAYLVSGNPEAYHSLFSAMIRNWRSDWDLKDFPFYFVQIAPYDYGENVQSQKLREAQLKTLSLPATGMAVTMDIGNPDKIHPANKQEVGRRLALWALAKDYGKDLVHSGPLYETMEMKENSIQIFFSHTGSGLMTKDKHLKNFEVAGPDGKFVKAEARIEKDVVVVRSPDVSDPRHVCYAWGNTAGASLFNVEGLPASPFNTKNWEE